jgi:hypothetical protein
MDFFVAAAFPFAPGAVRAVVAELGSAGVDVAAPVASSDVRRRGGIALKTSDVTACREG